VCIVFLSEASWSRLAMRRSLIGASKSRQRRAGKPSRAVCGWSECRHLTPSYLRRCHRAVAMKNDGSGELELASAADESAESASAAVYLFRSLADPARLTILRHLALGEHRVVDLTAHLGLAQSTTSAHLACLRDCGLVSSRTVGRASMYSLAVSAELMALLAAAERLLAATGDAVTLCPTNRGDDGSRAEADDTAVALEGAPSVPSSKGTHRAREKA
jgi:ArsR family transcriptional regulator, cadmium/lead-responsive transcriptional repressor